MIKKAILPVAGLGTRFLPASKAIPKEMVTVVDRPAIEYVVREAGSLEGDIAIAYSGLRPGEKLYEELLIDQDNTEYTAHSRILRSFEKHYPLQEIQAIFSKINQMTAVEHDVDWALTQLEHYVDGYQRSGEVCVN